MPNSLEDMIWGFYESFISHYAIEDIGPCGNGAQQQEWREKMQKKTVELRQALISFATMIASISWLEGSESAVRGVVKIFQLGPGYMSPPVVATCAKWLGAGEDQESRDRAIDQILELLNYRQSAYDPWRKVDVPGHDYPALSITTVMHPLNDEMAKIKPLPWCHKIDVDY